MKKTIYITRHAKSDWHVGASDYNRPLNPRGSKDAPRMGKHLCSKGFVPELIISSPANRAISTARLIAHEVGYNLDRIIEEESAYNAPYQNHVAILSSIPDSISSVMLFAHNPGLSYLVEYLTDESIELKTCCIACVELEVESWSALHASTCTLKEYISPKNID